MTKMDKLMELHDRLPDGEVVLDVRSEGEYAAGHVPGSINIPHDKVTENLEKLGSYKLVHIHCGGGGRARTAMAALTEAGLKNLHCIDDSGMRHWIEKGYAVEK